MYKFGQAALVTAQGHSRRFGRLPTSSALPLKTDIVTVGRHVSNVPKPEVTGAPTALAFQPCAVRS